MKTFLKFVVLGILLNAVRYLAGGPIKSALVLKRLFGAMGGVSPGPMNRIDETEDS